VVHGLGICVYAQPCYQLRAIPLQRSLRHFELHRLHDPRRATSTISVSRRFRLVVALIKFVLFHPTFLAAMQRYSMHSQILLTLRQHCRWIVRRRSLERRAKAEGGVVCRATAGIKSRAQPFGEQLAQKWPACRDVHDIDGCADLAYVPYEVLYRIWVREVIVAVEDSCKDLGCVRLVPAFEASENAMLTLKTPRPRTQLIRILRLSGSCVFGMIRNGMVSSAMSAEMFQAVAKIMWW
jgi:hypothetical protein